MNQSSLALLAVLGVLACVAALSRAVASWRGKPSGIRRPRRERRPGLLADLPAPWQANYRFLFAAAVVACVLVWAIAGRPVHGLIAFGVLAGLPFLLFPGGSARTEVEQLEAVSDWLQQLSSVVAAGKPLESAIHGTLATVPELLQEAVTRLAARMSDGMATAQAYRLFADDLATHAGDEVVQVFMMHTQTRGPGFARVIKQMASTTTEKAKDLRKLDAERARNRRKARNVTVLTLAVLGLELTSTGYTAWYRTAPGQAALLAVAALITGSLIWLRKTAQLKAEPRLLKTAAERAASGEE